MCVSTTTHDAVIINRMDGGILFRRLIYANVQKYERADTTDGDFYVRRDVFTGYDVRTAITVIFFGISDTRSL